MTALLVVDCQNDFMPWGSLPVTHGDQVVAVANALMPRADFVVATQDWHPANHGSFASNHPGRAVGDMVELGGVDQVLWPDHCVQHSAGASFHADLDVASIDAVIRKGTDALIDSYSAFYDNGHRKDTGLTELLRTRGASTVWMVGLATDYCVKFSALDALAAGFDVVVLSDGVRAVDLSPGDGQAALDQLAAAGASVTTSATLLG